MANRKTSKTYYFSVEGETEKWYLNWLQKTINAMDEAKHRVIIDCEVKEPVERAKSLSITDKTEVYHFSDYESNEDAHVKNFIRIMDEMKKATRLGKQIVYKFGYSNFSFELWIVLHKKDCSGSLTHRSQYLDKINVAYDEHFESLSQYKEAKAFNRCLNKLSLSDVIDAIKRSESITKHNIERGYKLQQYKGFKYYKENPSLAVWEAVKRILVDCNLFEAKTTDNPSR